jgi:hypothetical protein
MAILPFGLVDFFILRKRHQTLPDYCNNITKIVSSGNNLPIAYPDYNLSFWGKYGVSI